MWLCFFAERISKLHAIFDNVIIAQNYTNKIFLGKLLRWLYFDRHNIMRYSDSFGTFSHIGGKLGSSLLSSHNSNPTEKIAFLRSLARLLSLLVLQILKGSLYHFYILWVRKLRHPLHQTTSSPQLRWQHFLTQPKLHLVEYFFVVIVIVVVAPPLNTFALKLRACWL